MTLFHFFQSFHRCLIIYLWIKAPFSNHVARNSHRFEADAIFNPEIFFYCVINSWIYIFYSFWNRKSNLAKSLLKLVVIICQTFLFPFIELSSSLWFQSELIRRKSTNSANLLLKCLKYWKYCSLSDLIGCHLSLATCWRGKKTSAFCIRNRHL